MYMMPRLFPQNKKWFAILSALVLFMLVAMTGFDANAQGRRKRPTTQQQGTASTSTPQQKPPPKKITPLRSTDTADGSRITIRADAPLNDYSAYRSGDRYYVVIPEASAPAAQGGLRGRGFEDVQVQKRGSDTVLSFKLQPGTNARVSQKFDKLDVELTTPGRQSATVTPTPVPATSPTPRPTPAVPQATPATVVASETPTPRIPISPDGNNQIINPPIGGNPTVVTTPTPALSASPGVSPEVNPAQSPSAGQIAQAQPPPANQPITTSAPASSSPSLGVFLQRNWLILLLGALVLASLILIVAARSRAQRTATALPRARREKKLAASEKVAKELPKADTTSAVTAASEAVAVAATQPEVDVEAVAAGVVAAEAVKTAPAEEIPVAVEEETKEIAVVREVDSERIDAEVRNLLAGASYDESVIGASDAGTRQLVGTELLSALASRNVERHERARAAYIKHNYLDEATKNLRTADAPAERAAAARALGYVKDKSATPHLIAALEDEAPEVRRASVESLADLRDPAASEPLKSLLERERDRKVPANLIKSAIEASAVIEEETPTLEAESPTLEAEPQAVATADIASTEVASVLVAASAPLVIDEIETTEDETAAQQRAEEERLRLEEEARVSQAEAQRVAEVEAQRKAEEERLRLEAEAQARAEEEARRQAEEDAARLRAEEEARARAEEERRQAEEAARLKAEEESARQHAQEEEARRQIEIERRLEAERVRLEEEARQRAEAEARRKAEEETRLRAEEEARRAEEARLAAEAKRRAEEEEARRLAEEEAAATLMPEAISPAEPQIESKGISVFEWAEVDVSEAEVMHTAPPVTASPVEEANLEPISLESITAEPTIRETKDIEPSSVSIIDERTARPATKEIDYAVSEKGIATFDEFSTVPGIILKRLSSEEPTERAAAVADLARVSGDDSFREISAAFDDPAVEVRNAAARSLFDLNTDRAATFTRALREAPPERRRKIGGALASSGLASEAIGQLMGESREKTYDAFSLLFLMSKAGEVQPLMRAIEEHPNNEVRLAVVKLLALSGQQDILPAFRRLAVRGSLPTEVRSAVMEAIYQISSQSPTAA